MGFETVARLAHNLTVSVLEGSNSLSYFHIQARILSVIPWLKRESLPRDKTKNFLWFLISKLIGTLFQLVMH